MKLELGKLLKARKMKQAELAKKAGVSTGYVSLLVSGRKMPSQTVLARILDALDATPAEIFADNNQAREHTPSDQPSGGFAESEAVFLDGSPQRATKRQRQSDHFENTAAMVATRDHFALAILEGDILHVDLSDNFAKDCLAVINVADPTTGDATTLIRRVINGQPLPSDPKEQASALKTNDKSIAVMGIIKRIERDLR